MKLSKADREFVRLKFDGRCAYCGDVLGDRWHADHMEPVRREFKFTATGTQSTGKCDHPERHNIANMMPACAPCNLDKHSFPLEYWRKKLADACGVLVRNHSTYRFALKYGLVKETGSTIVFHFERVAGAMP